MAANRVSAAQLIDRIQQHGVNFELTPERRTQLKGEKVDESVLDAMVKARKK
jgi:hypothetical protein